MTLSGSRGSRLLDARDAADGALLLPPALRQLVFETDVAAVDTLRVLPLL